MQKERRKSRKHGERSTAELEPRNIAITRPIGKGEDTADLVRSLGWNPFIFHTVELRPLNGSKVREQVHSSLMHSPADWIVFMSSTGVDLFFENSASKDIRSELGHATNFLAVGPRTKEALLRSGVKMVSVPDRYSSVGISEFFSRMKTGNFRIVLIRSSSASDSLAKSLEKHGASVTTVNPYESIVPSDLQTTFDFLKALSEGRFYGILFTSAVSVSNLFKIASRKMSGERLTDLLKTTRIGAIGPATADELWKHHIESIIPTDYLIEAALKELIHGWTGRGQQSA